jgi:hypothetical protein
VYEVDEAICKRVWIDKDSSYHIQWFLGMCLCFLSSFNCLGIFHRNTKLVKIQKIRAREKAVILPIVQRTVPNHSVICTDQFTGIEYYSIPFIPVLLFSIQ